MDGGGVRGKGAGIVRGTIIQAGAIIEACRHFIDRSPQAGGRATGRVVGRGINGSTSEYPTGKSSGTGRAGKETDIGRSKIPGAYKA
jgi:hypothetical protein